MRNPRKVSKSPWRQSGGWWLHTTCDGKVLCFTL